MKHRTSARHTVVVVAAAAVAAGAIGAATSSARTARAHASNATVHVIEHAITDTAAQSFAVTLAGKQRVDAIRAQAATLERLISARQAARQRAARNSASQSIVEAIVALVLLTLLTALIGGVLGHMAVERERARDRSEQTSRILQESLLPSGLPEIPDCEVAARFVPASGLVGGDFYDVFETQPGSWAILLGDVCGKGPAAAAVTAMARWRLRTSLESGASVGDAMRALNEALLRQGADRRFLTAACITLTVEPDLASVEVVCAGHPSPVFVPRDGRPQTVSARGDLLGVLPTIRLHGQKLELRAGESLIAYTDGVADYGPEPGSLFEQTLVGRDRGAGAQQLVDLLEAVAEARPGPHRDDIAIIALQFVGDVAVAPAGSVAASADGGAHA